jgi:hypothetical protein
MVCEIDNSDKLLLVIGITKVTITFGVLKIGFVSHILLCLIDFFAFRLDTLRFRLR